MPAANEMTPSEKQIHFTNICDMARTCIDKGIIPIAFVAVGPMPDQAGVINLPGVSAADVKEMITLFAALSPNMEGMSIKVEPQKPSLN